METTSVIDTISTLNSSTGISNNMMAYRLSLIMEYAKQNPIESTNTPEKREDTQEELGKLLSTDTPSIEEYRQSLKNQFLLEYLNKFGVDKAESETKAETKAQTQSPTPTRVENLIAQKKEQFLNQMLEAQKPNTSWLQRETNNISKVNETSSDNELDNSPSAPNDLIPAVMGTVIAKGEDTKNQGRVYEGVAYRLQLLIQEGMQLLRIHRKNDQSKAFEAYKDDDISEFKVIENNLTPSETQNIIEFDRQRLFQENQTQSRPLPQNNSPEIGD